MIENQTCVLVTGVGGASLGREIMKAFRLAPTSYKIIASDMSPLSVGLYETSNKYLTPPASSSNYVDAILKISKKENVEVIAAGSEPEIEVVSKNMKIFEENNIRVLSNPWPVIQRCSDKYNLIQYLNSKGCNTPNSILYSDEKNLDEIEKFPVIIKPRIGSGSRNIFIAHDVKEISFFCNYLKKYGFEPIIQEHVGNYDEEYTIGVLYLDGGKICTSIAMKRILQGGLSTRQISVNPFNQRKYVISSGISQGLFSEFDEVRREGKKIAKIVEANGPVNIQCRKTESGIIPFEINPRFSGTTGSRSLVGYNEPHMFCRYVLFDELPKMVDYKEGYVMKDLKEKYISIDDINKIKNNDSINYF